MELIIAFGWSFKKTALAQKQNIRKQKKTTVQNECGFNSQISSNSSAPPDQRLLPNMCNTVTPSIQTERRFFMRAGDLWSGIITVRVLVS